MLRAFLLHCLAIAAFAGTRGDDQSELTIISARYGTDEQRIDVADVLRPLIAHDCFLLHAGWGLGNPDPAPDQIKDVQIVYRFKGARKSATFRQDENIILPTPTAAFTIVSASYGVTNRHVDVTEAIRARIVDGALRLPPNWGFGRVDPAAGTVKTVKVTYIHDGVPKTATFKQTQEIKLP